MLCAYEHLGLHEPDADEVEKAGFHRVAHFGLRITDRAAWEATVAREKLHVHYGGAYPWPPFHFVVHQRSDGLHD